MSGPASRRGFLRDLIGRPLIGGGLVLTGTPTAVAEPASPKLMREYANWLAFENFKAQREAYGSVDEHWFHLSGPAHRWHQERSKLFGFEESPAARAALVLSAVGCDWRA